jgi:flagellar protein FliS
VNPYADQSQAYRTSSVMTASPEQLVVMLYDGCIRFLRQAEAALGEQSWVQAGERLTRAEAILDELHCTLDMSQGELPQRLEAIYVFCKRCLVEARIDRTPVKVRHVVRLMADLREAWATLAAQAAAPDPGAVAAAMPSPPVALR